MYPYMRFFFGQAKVFMGQKPFLGHTISKKIDNYALLRRDRPGAGGGEGILVAVVVVVVVVVVIHNKELPIELVTESSRQEI